MATLSGVTIGFIGLGLMGRPMSLNLHRAGAELVIYNRSRGVVDELVGVGIEAAASPKDVAKHAPIIVLMVSDTPAVERVLFGDDGVTHGLQTGTIVIDMGTTAVTATRNFAERIKAKGADYVDAPVSGGQVGAEAAALAIMVGASKDAFARIEPVFKVLGKNITHVGEVGAGQVAKAANQIIVGLTIGAVAEALALAKRAGVDPAKVRQALAGGFAASRILEVHGLRMVDQTFNPGGKATTQRKDLAQALELAQELGMELPATALNRDLYDKLIDMGGGELDHSALIKVLE
ncbi:MAG: NAD(P)-dependent oxidoreductase [Gammaproteobacteria bacterium]|nr:NAD(P)-dependent oxidoreductase [Gammaproteobacteria bacterium]